MSNDDVFNTLEPVLTLCRNLDFSDPAEAEAWLEEAFPFEGPVIQGLKELCVRGLEEGWLCNRGDAGSRFSRVCKPSGPDQTCSLDAVLLRGEGPFHRHPKGEVDLCFPLEGDPTFDGRKPGWLVYGEESEHAPSVEGGAMLVLYILPEGAIDWVRA